LILSIFVHVRSKLIPRISLSRLMKTAKVKEDFKPKGCPKHTGKVWPHKRKISSGDKKQANDENNPF